VDYKIEFSKKAKKQFKSLPKLFQERLAPQINALASNPRPRGSIQLSGVEENVYRIRVGDYRIVYEIYDKILLIWIIEIGHRREIYRKK
jgi:addiction module toxin, RelE/StbE family